MVRWRSKPARRVQTSVSRVVMKSVSVTLFAAGRTAFAAAIQFSKSSKKASTKACGVRVSISHCCTQATVAPLNGSMVVTMCPFGRSSPGGREAHTPSSGDCAANNVHRLFTKAVGLAPYRKLKAVMRSTTAGHRSGRCSRVIRTRVLTRPSIACFRRQTKRCRCWRCGHCPTGWPGPACRHHRSCWRRWRPA